MKFKKYNASGEYNLKQISAIKKLPIVGVMGSSHERHETLALPLGKAIADAGYHLLNGGGTGVMDAVSKGFCDVQSRAGFCIGVIPMTENSAGGYEIMEGYPNPFVEIPVCSHLGIFDGHDAQQVSRNYINILTSQVVVALPGSKGTKNEVNLALRFKKPIILFGPEALFADFPAGLKQTEDISVVMRFIQAAIA